MVPLDTGTPGTSREIFSEDVDDGTRTRNPLMKIDKHLEYLNIRTVLKLVLGR